MQNEPRTANCPVLPYCPAPTATPPKSDAPDQPAFPAVQFPAADVSPAAKPRGFQLISKQQHLLIASRGGKTEHEKGLAHEYTREEALLAGRKGGAVTSRDREHMARIGRKGGLNRRRHQDERQSPPVPLSS